MAIVFWFFFVFAFFSIAEIQQKASIIEARNTFNDKKRQKLAEGYRIVREKEPRYVVIIGCLHFLFCKYKEKSYCCHSAEQPQFPFFSFFFFFFFFLFSQFYPCTIVRQLSLELLKILV